MGKEEDLASLLGSQTSPNPFPTPASITTGPVSFTAREGDGDTEMTDSRHDSTAPSAMDDIAMMDALSFHNRTDHDRINAPLQAGSGSDIGHTGIFSLLKICENRKVPQH